MAPELDIGTRQIRVFGALLIAFGASLGGVVLLRPERLSHAGFVLLAATLVAVVFDTRRRREVAVGLLAPLLFLGPHGLLMLGFPPIAVAAVIVTACAACGVVAAVAPPFGRQAFRIAVRMTTPSGWTILRLLLGVTYFCVVTPIAIVMRLAGRDVLALRGARRASYWSDHPRPGDDEAYFRQY
jgi:hypothetical protein